MYSDLSAELYLVRLYYLSVPALWGYWSRAVTALFSILCRRGIGEDVRVVFFSFFRRSLFIVCILAELLGWVGFGFSVEVYNEDGILRVRAAKEINWRKKKKKTES
jgi:hypothetical protein